MTLRSIRRDIPQAILLLIFLAVILCGVDLIAWLAAHPHVIRF